MKHRKRLRLDWYKKPAKRRIKLWQRPEFNIDTHVTNGNFKMSINGAELLSLRMESSLKRGVSTIAVDMDGNVYVDYSRPFTFADPKRLNEVGILAKALNVTTEQMIEGTYTHT
jgi:hypothetical protein